MVQWRWPLQVGPIGNNYRHFAGSLESLIIASRKHGVRMKRVLALHRESPVRWQAFAQAADRLYLQGTATNPACPRIPGFKANRVPAIYFQPKRQAIGRRFLWKLVDLVRTKKGSHRTTGGNSERKIKLSRRKTPRSRRRSRKKVEGGSPAAIGGLLPAWRKDRAHQNRRFEKYGNNNTKRNPCCG